MSTDNKDSGEQLELESQQKPGTLKSKLGITIFISILIIIAVLFFYLDIKKKEKIDELYQKGLIAEGFENYDEAIKRYREILEIQPLDARTFSRLGRAFHQKKEYEKAVENYKNALAINPKNAQTYFYLGSALTAQKKYGEAILNYIESRRLDPNN
jgi:tetratricopeptide (TPR) repeat protein